MFFILRGKGKRVIKMGKKYGRYGLPSLRYKANRKPVGLIRAATIKEAHKDREVIIVHVGKDRFADTYDVYVQRKHPLRK